MSKLVLAKAVVPKVTADEMLDPEILEFLQKVKRATG